MLKSHLKYLVCPKTGQKLILSNEKLLSNHIISGKLTTKSGATYYIKNGVPDLRINKLNKSIDLSERSFGIEWQMFKREGWDKREKNEKLIFYNYTRLIPSLLTNKVVCDVGCGNGRYINIIQKSNPKLIIGFDISEAALVAYQNTKHMQNVLIVRADIENPHFFNNFFDIIYSIGVLHHTKDAKKSFNNISQLCKENGILSLYLYGRGNPILLFFNNILRNFIFSKLPTIFLKLFSFFVGFIVSILRRIPIIGPIIIALLNKFIYVGEYHNIFDAYSAGYTSFHSPEEVEDWYHSNYFSCHIDVKQGRTALYCSGIKLNQNDFNEEKRMKVSPFKEIIYTFFTI